MTHAGAQPRTRFLQLTAQVGSGLLLAGTGSTLVGFKGTATAAHAQEQEQGEEVSANEDLMREHGILNRMLLVYEAALVRLDGQQDVDPTVLSSAAGIIRNFVEDYHERTEERQIFGGDGFDMARDQVQALEQQLGIYDLAQFTPT